MNIQFQANTKNNIMGKKSIEPPLTFQDSPKKESTFSQDAYNVTISEEGYESCKTFSKESREDTNAILETEKNDRFHNRYNELGSKVIVDVVGLTESKFYNNFFGLVDRTENEEDFDPEKRIQNLMDTYASMYDEIKKGYADGTREMWVVDSTAEDGFRQITEAEELDALDKSFTLFSDATEAYINHVAFVKEILPIRMEEFRAELEHRKSNYTQSEAPTQNISKIQNKLKDAAIAFREMYAVNANNVFLLSKQAIKDTFHFVIK